MRSPYISLLLVVIVGLFMAAGARKNRAQNPAAVNPTPVKIDWEKIQHQTNHPSPTPEVSHLEAAAKSAAATESTSAAAAKSIRIMCPNSNCHHIIVVPETTRGTVVKCSNCEQAFRIPARPPQTTP